MKTMEIEIEITKSVKELKTITLPHYRKSSTGGILWKVCNNEQSICVNHDAIQINYATHAWCLNDSVQCTEAEFTAAFNKTNQLINEICQ